MAKIEKLQDLLYEFSIKAGPIDTRIASVIEEPKASIRQKVTILKRLLRAHDASSTDDNKVATALGKVNSIKDTIAIIKRIYK